MTPGTDWRTLPAGPELDAIVAELVMGQEPEYGLHNYAQRIECCLLCGSTVKEIDGRRFFDDPFCTSNPIPPFAYSTTGDGMLLVLERMRELAKQEAARDPSAIPLVWMRFTHALVGDPLYPMDFDAGARAVLATMRPETIARAALAALEGEG